MIPNADQLLARVITLHTRIRDEVLAACERQALEELADVAAEDETGDTIYAVDRVGEEVLIDFFKRKVAPEWPLVLIAEGLPSGEIVLPEGTQSADALIRIIVDPIDGTRGLMYQKRSAWSLTGIAANRGDATRLRDIEIAVQTEIPLVKQHLSDMLWAVADGPLRAERFNRLTGETQTIRLHPSRAPSIAHGFATISRFFPGARDELSAIDEAVMRAVLGPPPPGKAQCFEDQYISSGGQLYELIAGHDRFIADLRPLIYRRLNNDASPGICSHPYDLCTWLLADKAGVILTDAAGETFDAPLNIDADVGWIGYANAAVRAQIEPALLGELQRRGLYE